MRILTTLCITLALTIVMGPTAEAAKKRKVKFQHEVGRFLYSPIAVMRWDDIVEDLKPDFELTSKGALENAIPKTAEVSSIGYNNSGFQITFGNQGMVETISKITDLLDASKSTSTETLTKDAPQAATADQNAQDSKLLELVKLLSSEPAVDPRVKYSLATGLYQEVALIKKYLDHPVMKYGYSPYVVRFTVAPTIFDQEFANDIYSRMSFFPSWKELTGEAEPLVIYEDPAHVVPLLVTEGAELASVNAAQEAARNISFGLSDFISGGLLGGGFSKKKGSLDQIASSDVNNTFSVARALDGILELRMGAEFGQGKTKGRDSHYTVTVLLLIKNDVIGPKPNNSGDESLEGLTNIRINALTSMDLDGRASNLKKRTRKEEVNALKKIAAEHYSAITNEKISSDKFKSISAYYLDKEVDHLIEGAEKALLDNSYSRFVNNIRPLSIYVDEESDIDDFTQSKMNLWLKMATEISSRPAVRSDVELPFIGAVELPSLSETYLLQDNGATWGVEMHGGKNLIGSQLKALVEMPLIGGKSIKFPGVVKNTPSKDGITINFPSAKSKGIVNFDEMKGASVHLGLENDPYREKMACLDLRANCEATYTKTNLLVVKTKAASSTAFTFTSETSKIVTVKGVGDIAFSNTVGKNGEGKLKADKIVIEIKGATIIGATSTNKDGGVATKPQIFNGNVTVAPNTRTVVSLKNLEDGTNVDIKPSATKGNKSVGELSTLTIAVK